MESFLLNLRWPHSFFTVAYDSVTKWFHQTAVVKVYVFIKHVFWFITTWLKFIFMGTLKWETRSSLKLNTTNTELNQSVVHLSRDSQMPFGHWKDVPNTFTVKISDESHPRSLCIVKAHWDADFSVRELSLTNVLALASRKFLSIAHWKAVCFTSDV